MDADGSNQTNVTQVSLATDYDPIFSPDGKKIAFTSLRDGNQEIYVMDADGTDQTNLTKNATQDSHPAFSPNGKKIAFGRREGSANDSEIYKMNASNGSEQKKLTRTAGFDYDPVFSPDGKKIAFTSARDGDYEIYTIRAKDGSRPQNRTSNDVNDFSPDWGVVSP